MDIKKTYFDYFQSCFYFLVLLAKTKITFYLFDLIFGMIIIKPAIYIYMTLK